eukprot:CAMPEP_0194268818 /NCGR_PEP_ID=MMETSP0169-20130528/3079_1 /TAXON_ID=218684 /ORGANISM="Corethron pennatum, Strain L29A3" /LENGTH=229 /DNA_ID=CAMNT_0039010205 /DNA_START=49 /DNA_END=738 /DNA_ORIENTATION=-
MKSIAFLLPLLLHSFRLTTATDQAGLDYLAENSKKDGVVVLPSGLQYKVLRSGAGTHHPTVDSSCECHYGGTLIDGTTFDSSYDRGDPTSFAPNQVIKGWTEAMQLMVEGDKWEMYIPSDLAYGDRGSPPKIPGGSALVFVMEIITINGDKVPAIRCEPSTKAGCDAKETVYIDKITQKYDGAVDKLKAEKVRLEKMQGSKMKPELHIWILKRISILNNLVEASDSEEL